MVPIMIVTAPIGKAGIPSLLTLIKIFESNSNSISIITGNDFNENLVKKDFDFTHISYNYNLKGFKKIFQFLVMQLKVSFYLLKKRDGISLIFFLYGTNLLLPALAGKMFGKKIIMILTGSSSSSCKSRNSIYSSTIEAIERINYFISDSLITFSPHFVNEWHLAKYIDKIYVAPYHFVNSDQFNIFKNINERENIVGFIGRFSEEKGIKNFLEAFPHLLGKDTNIKIFICGEGNMADDIYNYINSNNFSDYIEVIGWVNHDELPNYLNKFKLMVLPSFTEGLPSIMLEAMACGTPVLATPVGAIPNIIKNSETGFLMKNNSPECIAENVIRALEHPDLEGIAQRARALVEREFTFERAVERWRAVLEEVCNEKR